MRGDARAAEQLRPITITRQFTQTPAGSVLWQQGQTLVLCTVSITAELPPWFKEDRPGGWVTAEYVMHPASTPQRKAWPKIGHTDSRGTEIQRLIGRCLRAVVDLSRLGPHTLAVDCQVLQADGGTRTACICAAYVALRDALAKLPPEFPPPHGKPTTDRNGLVLPRYDPAFYNPAAALVDQVAAVSVAVVDGELRLDPDYAQDSAAEVDLNVAATAGGRLVEVQGSAESGRGFDRDQLNRMIDLALAGCANIMDQQRRCLLS
ncbi:MAG: ribonuclease PH [Tepidisphaeraceae bacterium]|jgi:ribonuclease PH